MKAFLIDKSSAFCYRDLLLEVNKSQSYCEFYKTSDLFDYFVNLIKAMANNVPLTLLDSDINLSELIDVAEDRINVGKVLPCNEFDTFGSLVSSLRNSKTELTIFTSGTTGQPKRVTHTVETLTKAVRTGRSHSNDIWAFAYNPTHMAGLQVFFQALFNQNTMVNVFNESRSSVLRLIDRHCITHISATPTFYRLLLPFEKEYPSVKRVTFGGEKSDSHLYESIKTVFPNAKLNNVYASTEAGTLLAAKGNCFQLPMQKRDMFRVVDEELQIHKSLLGYSESFKYNGDFYCTGDLIEWIDEANGLFRFKSRKNELVNVGGYKVNPTEVEEAIRSIQGVKETLVYGRPNSVLGNVLCADVQLDDGAPMTEVNIKQILKSRLQDFKIPRKIKIVENLELTRTGKLKRETNI